MEITFHFQSPITLKERNRLKAFIGKMFKDEKRILNTISFVFCSDEYLLEINRSYLQHDYYTDIITFDLTPQGITEIEAEIYISVERVRENASTFIATASKELHRVIFHGILHLCGYGDKTKREKELMTRKENAYLKKYVSTWNV